MAKNKMKKISVIIPTYNSYKTCLEAISSLQKQTVKPFEIIIINNASTDQTKEAIQSKFPTVRLINLRENTGVTGGRNKGIKEAKGDYLLLFDHDMVADKKMIEELIKVMKLRKNIGIVTPKIYYFERKDIIWSAGTDVNLFSGQTLFRGGKDTGQFEKIEEVAVAPSILLIKKEVVKKIGYFDPVYFATYEDTDFCFRAKKYGLLTYYSPNAVAYHKIPFEDKLSKKRLTDRAYLVARNRIIFMKRFSKYFLFFLFFIPVYFVYYTMLAIQVRNILTTKNYLRGVFDGLFRFS